MKNSYNNLNEVTLTSWPTSVKERKGSFEICLCAKKNVELNPGDEVKGTGNKESVSVYTIQAVVEKRPAAVKGYDFIRAKATWQNRQFR